MDKRLSKNVVLVAANSDEYNEIVDDAEETISNQIRHGINKKQRTLADCLECKTFGYLGEYGVKKFAKSHGIEVNLAHQIGEPEQFFNRDIDSVVKDGVKRNPRKNIGIKSNGAGSVWIDIPRSQFLKSDQHMVCKVLTDRDHLSRTLLSFRPSAKPKKRYEFVPIYVFLIGFVPRNYEVGFTFSGTMARTVYTVHEASGIVPKNYAELIRRKERLITKNPKVEFNTIKKFGRLDECEIFLTNLAQAEKPAEDILKVLKEL